MDVSDQQIHVAIVAEHASAKFGGEAMLPLQYFRHLRKRGVDAYLVVHARTISELEELFPKERDRIFYVTDTWLHRVLWRLGEPLPDRVRTFTTSWMLHLLTQAYQRPIIRRLVRERGVNVVHEPIPVSPCMPSLMYNVGAPVIIGPMNGGMTYPPGFRYLESPLERYFVRIGRWLSFLINWLIPGKRRAALLLVANQRTHRVLPSCVCSNVINLVDNGIDTEEWRPSLRRPGVPDQRLRFAFIGRLVDLKNVNLLLEAFVPLAHDADCHLEIIGDGPERLHLESICSSLGLSEQVTFHGFVPHEQCRVLLSEADALVLPSVKECGGAVVLEAMALGLPTIVTNWGGPADYVRPAHGILVDPLDRVSFVMGLTAALWQLASSLQLRTEMGERASEEVLNHYSWQTKIFLVTRLYLTIIQRTR